MLARGKLVGVVVSDGNVNRVNLRESRRQSSLPKMNDNEQEWKTL